METLYDAYLQEVGGDRETSLDKPGAARMAELFIQCGLVISEEQIQEVYECQKWNAERSCSWSELHEFAVKCGLEPEEILGEASRVVESTAVPSEASGDEEVLAEEAADLAALVDRIAQRAADREFPYVKPNELKSLTATEEAENILLLTQKLEAVKLQSFLDGKYEFDRKDCPADPSVPEKKRRWEYSLNFYDLHAHEFICMETLRLGIYRHRFDHGVFLPVVSPSTLKKPEDKLEAARSLDHAAKLKFAETSVNRTFDFLQSFDAALWAKWNG